MKKNKGITLIALVITIIVLIILAGITIATLVGENGILNQTQQAKEKTEIGNEKEIVELAALGAMEIDKSGQIKEEKLKEELNKLTVEGNTEVTNLGESYEVYFIKTKRYYEIEQNGKVGKEQIAIEDKFPGDITKDINGNNLEGNKEQPYQINCIEDLVALSTTTNSKANNYLGKSIKLMRTLNFNSERSYVNPKAKYLYDATANGYVIDEINGQSIKTLCTTEAGFIPIGNDYSNAFQGSFDCESYLIKNLYINMEKQEQLELAGLFGFIKNSSINNVVLTGKIISSNSVKYIGGIVAYGNNGDISTNIMNCSSNVSITQKQGGYIGGIVGCLYGKIENSTNNGNIDVNIQESPWGCIGGIAGIICDDYLGTAGFIKGGVNNGEIKVIAKGALKYQVDEMKVGGILGYNNGIITENCINNGTIYVKNESQIMYAGGIVGYNDTFSDSIATIKNSKNNANLTAEGLSNDIFAGGIVGYNESGSVIENSTNLGSINATTSGTLNKGDIYGKTE